MDLSFETSFATPASNSTLLLPLLLSLAQVKYKPSTNKVVKDDYDFIIVGGGSAGSTLAARLSELSCISILLLEAGSSPPILTEVPAYKSSFEDTSVDWNFTTVPQTHTASGMVNNGLKFVTGKVLGGSSTINWMVFLRGNKESYDDWAANGAKGWSYKDVLPYFLKLENDRVAEHRDKGYHGTKGPVTEELPKFNCDLQNSVIDGLTGFGYSQFDPNGKGNFGVWNPTANTRHGQRCGVAKAYLVPAEKRPNLDIVTGAFVTKVVIENGRATGVLVDIGGVSYAVGARREVVVSAGGINTPKVLMLSGIGPREQLEKLNIPVIADLPVGQNFQNHVSGDVMFELGSQVPIMSDEVARSENIDEYIRKRTGILSSPTPCLTVGYLNSSKETPFPEFQLYFYEVTADVFKKVWKPEVYQQVLGPYEGKPLLVCRSQNQQPKSRGSVTLASTDPYQPPLIDPNSLGDPDDVRVMVEGMKMCSKVSSTGPLLNLGAQALSTAYPGCEDLKGDEDKYYECQVRSVIDPIFHYAGTAKMGNKNDTTTVVDSRLRVKGISGLRVVDISIMPTFPSGNPNIPAIMIGEKAADMIKKKIGRCPRRHRRVPGHRHHKKNAHNITTTASPQ